MLLNTIQQKTLNFGGDIMYCSKCGNLLNENGACSNCDLASTHVTVANPPQRFQAPW